MSRRTKLTVKSSEEDLKMAEKKGNVIGPTYEKGKPGKPDRWRDKMRTREEMEKYLKTAEGYKEK